MGRAMPSKPEKREGTSVSKNRKSADSIRGEKKEKRAMFVQNGTKGKIKGEVGGERDISQQQGGKRLDVLTSPSNRLGEITYQRAESEKKKRSPAFRTKKRG